MNNKVSRIYEYDKKVTAAFKKDCEELLEEYEKFNTFSFDDFAKLWRAKNFSYVFASQTSALLLRDFCDDCFYTVKKYIVFARSLYTQVAAFYMLYALYYKQPVRNWVKIRITKEEFQKILELLQEMKNIGQLVPVYIFRKMILEDVFLFVAMRTLLGPEDRFVKKVEYYYNDTFKSAKTSSSLMKFSSFNSLELLSSLEKTNDEYHELLKKCSGKCKGLDPFPSTIVSDIKSNIEDFTNTKSLTEMESLGDDYKRVISVKQKAQCSKNAVYRASRDCKAAVDDDMSKEEETEDDPDWTAEKRKRKGKKPAKGNVLRKKGKGGRKSLCANNSIKESVDDPVVDSND